MKLKRWSLGRGVLRDLRRSWPQLLLTDLLARMLAAILIMPLAGLLMELFVARTTTGVLTDEEILFFLVRPLGLAALCAVGAVFLAIVFAELGGLVVIGFGAADQRRVTFLEGIRRVGARAAALLSLGGHLVVRVLLITAPFLLAGGAVYLVLLTEHDINFYLAHKPSEYWIAVLAGGLLGAGLAGVLLWKSSSWILALPMALGAVGAVGAMGAGSGGGQVLRHSVEATRGHRGQIARWLLTWLAVSLLLSLLMALLLALGGRALVPQHSRNLILVAAGIGAVLLIGGVGNLAVTFVNRALFALLVVHLHRAIIGPGELEGTLASRGTLQDRAALPLSAKTILWGSIAALIVITTGTYFMVQDIHSEDHTAIIAHRGASGAAPENTLAAFERAIDDHADWIEIDVQESADGVVVVLHDTDFMKVAGVKTKVWDANLETVRKIDVGSWFSPEYSDQRVPTLQEALEAARGRIGVFIELKYYGHDQDLEARVIDIVDQTGMESEIVLMSLKYDGISKAAALRPAWTCGSLAALRLGDLTRRDVDFLAVTSPLATRALIRRAHRQGKKVYVWTVNNPIQMSVMMSRGVDGLITDEPALAHQVQELRADLSPFGRLLVWIGGETGLLRGMEESSEEEDA